jgi:LuxR family transcriptional regulator, maltose regulon positive regulatory protein
VGQAKTARAKFEPDHRSSPWQFTRLAFYRRTAISQHGVIPRRRLLQLAGKASEPITLVSAPAGYGKTTLLRQWASKSTPVVRLDPAEITDQWQLWQQVGEALSRSVVTVIIDDLHLLERDRGTVLLRDALHRAGGKRRLVIATRSDPILALHEARMAGKVLEIRADELAFDKDETQLFLAANHIAVSTEQAYALWVHTEGWPAGLRLSTTPLASGAHSKEAFSTLLQGDSAVGSYLMGQALAYTADDLREFLLQTSVSEFLDAELAAALTDRSDSALLLERAHIQPGFLHRLPDRRWPYRYHPMFRALLLAELMRSAPDEVRRLSALAATWFSRHGEHVRAAPLAMQAQSWNVLAESVLAGSCAALMTGEWSWVRNTFALLPDSNFEASLSVRLAAILLKLGSGARMEAMQSAAAIVNDPRLAETKLEAAVLRFVEAWRVAEQQQTGEALQILEVDPGRDSAPASSAAETGLRSAWHQLQAACLFVEGPPSAVHSVLNESRDSSTNSYPNAQLGDLEIRAWAAVVAGDLRSAQHYLDHAAAMIERESARGALNHAGTTWFARQWVEMETGDHATTQFDHAAERHSRSAFPQPISQALEMITDARLRLIRDNDSRGCALMLDDVISTNPRIRQSSTIGSLWAISRISAYLAAAEFSNALDRALNSSMANASTGSSDGSRNQSYLWAWAMQRAALDPRAGVLAMDPELLISNLPLESALPPGRSEALRVRVLLGAASLAFRAEMPERASHYLRLALQSTEVHGWRRPYVEIAAAITPVLEAERRRITSHGEQVIELLTSLRQQPVYGGQLPDPLSARELEILQYLPTPLDQRELCSALFISRNTLKTHLRSTYRKLGVQTRREAVLRAESLGIL